MTVATFTPPSSWSEVVDGAARARHFVEQAETDPRLPCDWGAMTSWFTVAILAGQKHTATPTRLDLDDQGTWPEDGQRVLRWDSPGGWDAYTFDIDEKGPVWSDPDTAEWWESETGALWLPLPPTPGGEE